MTTWFTDYHNTCASFVNHGIASRAVSLEALRSFAGDILNAYQDRLSPDAQTRWATIRDYDGDSMSELLVKTALARWTQIAEAVAA